MKSYQVVDYGQPLRPVETPTPAPQGSEILVKVTAAGVCHSDLHIWEGGYDLGGGRRLLLKDRGVSLPLTMGHEICGEVAAVGPQVSGRKVGESCVVYPWIGCGTCRVCRAGEENLCMKPKCLGVHCHGGYSDHVVVPHERYLVPLKGIDPIIAAPFACSGLTTYSALKKFGPMIGEEPIIVIGAGGLGLMALTILKALGGKGAIVVDIDAGKRAAAMAAGALAAVDGTAADAVQQIQDAAGGPVWAVLDLVGTPATTELAFNLIAKGGKIVIVGLFGGAAPWSLPLIPMRAATIQGSYTGSLPEFRELIELLRSGKIGPMPIVRRNFDEANTALEALRQGQVIGRTVLAV